MSGSGRGPIAQIASRLHQVRIDYLDAYHEREQQLRHELIGDVDIDALRAERAARADGADRAERAPRDDLGTRRPTPRGSDTDTEGDTDGDLPYSFF